jgi:hypothetical protein
MSISYNKDVRVVFMVKEGTEPPREATEEDFLRAGYVPAAGRGHVNAPAADPAAAASPVADADASEDESDAGEEGTDPASCEDCLFLGEDHVLIELVTLPDFVEGILDPFKGIGLEVKDTIEDAFKGATKVFGLNDLKSEFLDPLFKFDPLAEPQKPVAKEKAAPVTPDFAGDLFKGAFSVFNTVKDGLTGLLEPVDYTQPPKPAAEKTAPVTPEPVKEETPAEEKPEFSEFEQSVIGKFAEMGFGADAESALRKSKEFSEFLVSNKPTPEQARAFTDMLKNGKPPFFG